MKKNDGSGNNSWRHASLLIHVLALLYFIALCDCLVQRQQPSILPASKEELYPPLVLLGGIAQTKSSWDHHLAALTRNRRVLVYDFIDQGENGVDDETTDVSLLAQAQRLLETLDETLISENGDGDNFPFVDLAGFSFGGRVAMATACLLQMDSEARTEKGCRLRRLHLTGVGCDRSDFGHLAMRSFVDVVQSDPSLRSFAWSILLATHSPRYLRNLPENTIQRILDQIASTNNPKALLARLNQSEISDPNDPWHVVNMADRLSKDNNIGFVGKLCVGEFDHLAPVDEVERLREKSGWILHEVDVLPDCGHAVTLEKPRVWRESVLSFLAEDDDNKGIM